MSVSSLDFAGRMLSFLRIMCAYTKEAHKQHPKKKSGTVVYKVLRGVHGCFVFSSVKAQI